MLFKLNKYDTDTRARAGTIENIHGSIRTPVFMPVGTQATVKSISPAELSELGYRMILANTYHLFLRPGTETIQAAGGLHRFSNWNRNILTDSGGFQIFSLSSLRRITDEGVRFQSHLDGSTHFFTPERIVDIQKIFGSDIMMVLDECIAYPASYEEAMRANDRTLRWAERCQSRYRDTDGVSSRDQALFGIVQGSAYARLRRVSIEHLVNLGFDGYAIGGLAVGEPKDTMLEMIEVCTAGLPKDRPRYLMGVGKPEDIVEAVSMGVDMFDCVIPTRNARNGTLYTSAGKMSIRNRQFAEDFRPVDPKCSCMTCRSFSRAYLRHLFQAEELLGLRLATIHNLAYYQNLLSAMREAIEEERFGDWRRTFQRNQVVESTVT